MRPLRQIGASRERARAKLPHFRVSGATPRDQVDEGHQGLLQNHYRVYTRVNGTDDQTSVVQSQYESGGE